MAVTVLFLLRNTVHCAPTAVACPMLVPRDGDPGARDEDDGPLSVLEHF